MLHRLLSKDERTIALEIASQAAAMVQGAATTGNGTQSILNADGTRSVSGPNLTEINGSTVTTATHVGDVTPPGAPTGITTATESGVLTVDWDGTLDGGVPGDFDHITVYAIKSDATLGVSLGKLKMRGTVTTAGLTPGDEYDIYVTAEDDACLADGTPAHNVSMESGPYNVTIAGSTGDAVSTIDIEYATGSSETTAPASGWSTDSPTWAEGLYVWQRTKVTTGSGEVSYSDPACIQGAKGDTGPKGDTGSDGIAGKDGVGITDTAITYAVSPSGTTAPTTGWQATPPSATAGQYMWTRTVWAYTDSTSETGYAVGKIGDTGATGAKGDKGDTGADGAPGADGVGLTGTAISYAKSTSGTTTPTAGWQETVPTSTPGQYLWTRTVWTYSNATTETGYSVAMWGSTGPQGATGAQGAKGAKGDTGSDGIAGKDGVGITDTAITYAVSPSGTTAPTTGWQATPPSATAGQYMWTRTVWAYTDSTSETGYAVGKIGDTGATGAKGDKGDTGADGAPGADGVGLTGTAISYAKSTSGTTTPTAGWQETVPTSTPGQYLWTRTVWTYSNATTETGYSVAMWGSTGPQGATGAQGAKGAKGDTGSDGIAGKDGVGITDTAITYAVSPSGTTAPTTGWQATPPSATAGQYMWTRTVWAYTDSTSETGYAVGKIGDTGATGAKGDKGDTGADGAPGADGVGLTGTAISYAKSTSGTTTPTAGWQETVPTSTPGQYLWTRTVWTYSNATTETGYSVAMWGSTGPQGATGAQGAKGAKGDTGSDGIAGKDGVGITDTAITYAVSPSGTTAPTTGWQATPPSATAGQYMWTRTVWAYTDSTSETGYAVGKIGDTGATGAKGDKGDTGADGAPGADGVGLTGTAISYAKSTSGTTTPTAGWQETVPTSTPGQYLWTRTVWTYSNATTETGYSVAMWGSTGPQGATGAQGAKGAKGDTGSDGIAGKDGVGITDTAITYAVSPSGTTAPTTGWQATPPSATAGQYMWTKTVWTYSDATSETGYSVGKIGDTGAKGATGATGVGFASIRPQYYLSTSKTELAGGSWLDTCPTWTPGTYYWTRSVLTKTDGTINYTDSVLDQASTKANETAYATTQYVWHDDDGLHVSQTGEQDTSGLNMLLTSSKMALRYISTELATFSSNLIELGKNSVSAVIQLCGGTGIMRSDAFGTGRMLSIVSSNVGISAGTDGVMSLNGGSALGAKAKTLMRSDITSGQTSHKELGSSITQTGTDISLKMTQTTNSIGAPNVEDFDINLHQDANGKVNLNITPDVNFGKATVSVHGTVLLPPVVTTISGWTVLAIGSLRVVSRTITADSNAYVSNTWGSVYESTTSFATPAYPVRFASMPYSSIEYLHGDPGASFLLFVERVPDATVSTAGSFYLWRPTALTVGHPVYTVLAVGTV